MVKTIRMTPQKTTKEYFDVVDEHNVVIGSAPRSECHGNPGLIHRTSHVVVFHSDGRLLLQKRSMSKDIQPGKWDTAVGGHLDPGEDFITAAKREMSEELGVKKDLFLDFLFDTKIRNDIESENVRVFSTVYNGPFNFCTHEIDEIRFWTATELRDPEERKNFTPNLILELDKLFELELIK
ncbi:MAG: NUDIX domain-containing protein [Victivallales bacterium]|nr:NUDIX domain-containing protein [Victivallales bacterium]